MLQFCYLVRSFELPEFLGLRGILFFWVVSERGVEHFVGSVARSIFSVRSNKIDLSGVSHSLSDFMVSRRSRCYKLCTHGRNVLLRARNPD